MDRAGASLNADVLRQLKQNKRRETFKTVYRFRYVYLLVVFGIVFFCVFHYAPLYGLQLAFKKFQIKKGIWGSPWIGLDNFKTLFARAEFWTVFQNTLVISLQRTFLSFPVPIVLAIVINEVRSVRLSRTLQVVYTLPHFLSWVTISGIMLHLLASSGAANSLLTILGLHTVPFLSDGIIFRAIIVFTEIWKESGWSSIVYLAAIASIDPSFYESATIDGVNRLQKAWYITFPCIRSTAAVLLILAVGGVMSAGFDQVFNLYNPTVYKYADIIDTYIYRITFEQAPNYGLSTAVGLFKGIINAVLLFSANYVVGRLDRDARMI